MNWLATEWALWLPLVAGAVALWLLLPSPEGRLRGLGAALGAVAIGTAAAGWLPVEDGGVQSVLFGVFAVTAVGGAGKMITDRSPVYAALWFAVATLGVCGLFVLNSAPFLAAATVIVYAGAIVVTFVFVIMLAQSTGASGYDNRTQNRFAAVVGSMVLLGCFVFTIQQHLAAGESRGVAPLRSERRPPANLLSVPVRADGLGTLRGFGRSLFGDYLYSVELAGSLLLIATIGAIAVAPRRTQGAL